MPRRKKNQATIKDLIDLFSLLPWWSAFALAAVAYFTLHWIAGWQAPTASNMEELTGAIYLQFLHVGATIGQFLLPMLLVVSGTLSWARRWTAARLVDGIAEARIEPGALTWHQFERTVGEIYRRQGYSVAETAGGADGGVDLVLRRGSEKYLVQCKHWKARQVGVKVVRELKGVIAACDATGGAVVTSGRFSRDALEFARTAGIDLVDGRALFARVQRAPPAETHPNCPDCGSTMVERMARRGSRAGQSFWGCSRFPECRATVAQST